MTLELVLVFNLCWPILRRFLIFLFSVSCPLWGSIADLLSIWSWFFATFTECPFLINRVSFFLIKKDSEVFHTTVLQSAEQCFIYSYKLNLSMNTKILRGTQSLTCTTLMLIAQCLPQAPILLLSLHHSVWQTPHQSSLKNSEIYFKIILMIDLGKISKQTLSFTFPYPSMP